MYRGAPREGVRTPPPRTPPPPQLNRFPPRMPPPRGIRPPRISKFDVVRLDRAPPRDKRERLSPNRRSGPVPNQDRSFKASTICTFILQEKCKYRDNCKFAHSADELNSNWRSQLCKFASSGTCRFGHFCRFAHSPAQLRAPVLVTDREYSVAIAEIRTQLEEYNLAVDEHDGVASRRGHFEEYDVKASVVPTAAKFEPRRDGRVITQGDLRVLHRHGGRVTTVAEQKCRLEIRATQIARDEMSQVARDEIARLKALLRRKEIVAAAIEPPPQGDAAAAAEWARLDEAQGDLRRGLSSPKKGAAGGSSSPPGLLKTEKKIKTMDDAKSRDDLDELDLLKLMCPSEEGEQQSEEQPSGSYEWVERERTSNAAPEAVTTKVVKQQAPPKPQEEQPDGFVQLYCVVCAEGPLEAALLHEGELHTCCCMKCARELEIENKPCPICDRPVEHVFPNSTVGLV